MIGNANAANMPSTSANQMMNQPGVGGISQQNSIAQQSTMNMGPSTQRQPNQNASMMMNQAMSSSNLNTLQQMKQNQQQMSGNNMPGNMFGGVGGGGGSGGGAVGAGAVPAGIMQQRQVRLLSFFAMFFAILNVQAISVAMLGLCAGRHKWLYTIDCLLSNFIHGLFGVSLKLSFFVYDFHMYILFYFSR